MLVLGAYVVLPIALVAGEASLLPLIGLLSLPLAIKPLRTMSNRTDGPALNGALAGHRRPARRLQPAGLARPAARQLSHSLRGLARCHSPRSRSSHTRFPSASPT